MAGSGVGAPLPYDLHPWLPITLASDAVATSLPLSASSAAAGASTRRGTTVALTAPLTATAGAGAAGRRGAGAACTLPLTAPVATGHAIAQALAAAGAAILLPFTTVSGSGGKSVTQQVGVLGLQLVDMQASGSSRKQGYGSSISLVLHLGDTQANKYAGSPGSGPELRIVFPGQAAGRRFQFVFTSPTDVDKQPFSPIYPNTLWYAIPYGMTVWQDAAGEWHQMRGPNPQRLIGALRIYEGGRLHTLSADEIAILSAAGYADNIILQEMH